ncbi:GNAT family N-acetyltransferase [Shewanella waksmanii]|uniref:GNAT family N-acetyltransferase n=1 Tax=Shewanella waksmanii TaxID=213783 RepID=UPI003735E6AB
MKPFESAGISLREVESGDLELLRQWRNDPAIRNHMCDTTLIDESQQARWFQNIKMQNADVHFVAEYRNSPIGYINLKARPEGEYESGLYVGNEKYRGSFLSFFIAIAQLDYAFSVLKAKGVFAQVKKTNTAALRFNFKLGYQESDSYQDYINMRLTPSSYKQQRKILTGFIR